MRRTPEDLRASINEARERLIEYIVNDNKYFRPQPGGEAPYIDCVTHLCATMYVSEQTARTYLRIILLKDYLGDFAVRKPGSIPRTDGRRGANGLRRIRYTRMKIERPIISQLHEAATPKLEDLI